MCAPRLVGLILRSLQNTINPPDVAKLIREKANGAKRRGRKHALNFGTRTRESYLLKAVDRNT